MARATLFVVFTGIIRVMNSSVRDWLGLQQARKILETGAKYGLKIGRERNLFKKKKQDTVNRTIK